MPLRLSGSGGRGLGLGAAAGRDQRTERSVSLLAVTAHTHSGHRKKRGSRAECETAHRRPQGAGADLQTADRPRLWLWLCLRHAVRGAVPECQCGLWLWEIFTQTHTRRRTRGRRVTTYFIVPRSALSGLTRSSRTR